MDMASDGGPTLQAQAGIPAIMRAHGSILSPPGCATFHSSRGAQTVRIAKRCRGAGALAKVGCLTLAEVTTFGLSVALPPPVDSW